MKNCRRTHQWWKVSAFLSIIVTLFIAGMAITPVVLSGTERVCSFPMGLLQIRISLETALLDGIPQFDCAHAYGRWISLQQDQATWGVPVER